MRIKYRVWDKNKKSFIEDYIGILPNGSLVLYNIWYDDSPDSWYCDESWTDIADENQYVIQQSTGKSDQAGKEIYVGDIIRFEIATPLGLRYPEEFTQWEEGGKQPQIIYWEVKSIVDLGNSYWYNIKNKWEIVGNIFENPELLR